MPTPIDFKVYSAATTICEKAQQKGRNEKKKEVRKNIFGIAFFIFIVVATAYALLTNSPSMPVTENIDDTPYMTTAELTSEDPI